MIDGATAFEDAKRQAPADRRTGPSAPLRLWKAEWVYLALALVFGSLQLFLTAPFQAPDEESHFRRAFAMSEGRLVCIKYDLGTGDVQPRALTAAGAPFARIAYTPAEKTSFGIIRSAGAIAIDPDDREFVAFSNAAIHPPLVYVPQAAGIFLARRFSSSVMACFYAGRLANLLATVGLTFVAVRLAPVGRWAFACFGLTPMTLFLDASLSADALTNALAFLFIAQVLACAAGPATELTRRELVMLALTGAGIGLSKQAYFLLPLAYLMIPVARLGTRRRYAAGLVVVMAATLIAVGSWAAVVRGIYSPSDTTKNVDPSAQLRLMITDPVQAASAMFHTANLTGMFVEEYVGQLGQLDTRLPLWLVVAEVLLLTAVCVLEFGPQAGLANWQSSVAAAVAGAVILSVLVAVHLTWDPVGGPVIAAQGRYFIPVGPLVGIGIARLLWLSAAADWSGGRLPRLVRAATPVAPIAIATAVSLLLTVTLHRLYERYFVDHPADVAERLFTKAEELSKAGRPPAETRRLVEEALRADPGHADAHRVLGQLLLPSDPDKALEHFRAALRRTPDDPRVLNDIATFLFRDADYAESIRLYREAARLAPRNAEVRENLARALQASEAMDRTLAQISTVLPEIARNDHGEARHTGTSDEGLYLKENRTRVLDSAGRDPFPRPFVWHSPPPNGSEIRLFGAEGATVTGRREPFYACSAAGNPRRVFVFPPPRGAVILPDASVSWYFQVPLSELNAIESREEQAYRTRLGLTFPLDKLPD